MDSSDLDDNINRCPICVEPTARPYITYLKSGILSALRRYLWYKKVDSTVFIRSDLEEMLKEFPLAYKLYNEGTYRTFTLHDGDAFADGRYFLGPAFVHEYRTHSSTHRIISRWIICSRCNRQVRKTKTMVLMHYLGFEPKYCRVCDRGLMRKLHLKPKKPKVKQLWKPKKPTKLDKAKELNVSLNDYRRGILEGPPILPNGTEVNGLIITKAWYDDTRDVYTPKYTLKCPKCERLFSIAQKKVQNIHHFCKGKPNVSAK